MGERDDLTARYWNQQDIRRTSVRSVRGLPTVEEQVLGLFGTRLSAERWARLLGVPDGAQITLTVLEVEEFHGVMATVRHRWYAEPSRRFFYRNVDKLTIENVNLVLRLDAPTGAGTRIFAHEAREAAGLGVAEIDVAAVGRLGSRYNGYYTWARLGFNGAIPESARIALESQGCLPHLYGVIDMNDLITREGGPAWWKANGVSWNGTFGLQAGSRQWHILTDYTWSRGVRL